MKNSFLETIKAVDGEVFHMPYHQKRYESVLNTFGTPRVFPRNGSGHMWEYKKLSDYIHPPSDGIYRCRLVYSPQTPNIIDVTYHKYEKRKIESLKIVYDDNIDYSCKSTCRDEIDKLFAKKDSCDDILIVKNSFISDTSIANIAFLSEGEWITPRTPLLKGTTRARLLDEGKIIEKDIRVSDLKNYSKVALLNAMIDFDIIQNMSFVN